MPPLTYSRKTQPNRRRRDRQRRSQRSRAVSRAIAVATSLHETLNAANPNLERESALCATCQYLIGSQLVNFVKMIKQEGQNLKLDRN